MMTMTGGFRVGIYQKSQSNVHLYELLLDRSLCYLTKYFIDNSERY